MADKQIYGRKRFGQETEQRNKKERKKTKSRYFDAADLVFVIGAVTVMLFLYRMTGGLTADAELLRTEPEQTAMAVMSTGVSESDGEKEILQEVTGEPFGYMTGEWNLWEYIGDLMASLLLGG